MDLLTPSFGLIIWTLLAFVIVAFILKKYAWKPILKSLDTREKNIASSNETAERIKAEMAQMQNENEALLAKAREERALLLKEARETRDKLVNDAKEQAKIEASRIVSEAQQAIQQQKMAAIAEVKNQVSNLVIDVAEKVLRRELSNKTEQEKYIKQLSNEVIIKKEEEAMSY